MSFKWHNYTNRDFLETHDKLNVNTYDKYYYIPHMIYVGVGIEAGGILSVYSPRISLSMLFLASQFSSQK